MNIGKGLKVTRLNTHSCDQVGDLTSLGNLFGIFLQTAVKQPTLTRSARCQVVTSKRSRIDDRVVGRTPRGQD
jgi:hypothetical protein